MRRSLTLVVFLLTAPTVLAANPGIVQTSAVPGLGDYQYDGSGNITQAGPRTYAYDRFGRLSSVTNGNLTEQAYTYDRHGNLLTMTTTAVNASNATTSQTTRLGVNAKTNHLDQNSTNGVANNMVATYDAFGNIAWSPTGTFQHDQFNMPKESTVGGVRTLYLYSASDERIASIHPALAKEYWTLRDPQGRVLRRMDRTAGSWSWSQDYIYGASRLIASAVPGTAKVLHYHADHLGTPRLITGNGGAQVGRHDYYPFGLEMPGSTNDGERLQFTGHERDAATLDYMHARYYDASMGRFLSVDPVLDVKQAMTNPQGWNRYAYVFNNPLRFTDPTGKYVCRGDEASCKTIEATLGVMKQAAAGLKNNDPRKAQLNQVIAAYGKPDDAKTKISTVWADPTKQDGSPLLKPGQLGQAGREGNVFLSLTNVMAKAGGNSDKAFLILGGTMTHEGKHELQPSVVGLPVGARPSMLSLVFHERQAYVVEQGYYQGLGEGAMAPDPTKGAFASAAAGCNTPQGCDP